MGNKQSKSKKDKKKEVIPSPSQENNKHLNKPGEQEACKTVDARKDNDDRHTRSDIPLEPSVITGARRKFGIVKNDDKSIPINAEQISSDKCVPKTVVGTASPIEVSKNPMEGSHSYHELSLSNTDNLSEAPYAKHSNISDDNVVAVIPTDPGPSKAVHNDTSNTEISDSGVIVNEDKNIILPAKEQSSDQAEFDDEETEDGEWEESGVSFSFEKIKPVKNTQTGDSDDNTSTFCVTVLNDDSQPTIADVGVDSILQRMETPALCDECLKPLTFKMVRAKRVCFHCELFLCPSCVNFHLHHLPLSAEETHADSRGVGNQQEENDFNALMNELTNEKDPVDKLNHENRSLSTRLQTRHEKDIKDIWIRDIAVLNNGLVAITDSENNCVKLINISSNINRRIELSSWPCGIVEIEQDILGTKNMEGNKPDAAPGDNVRPDKSTIAVTCPNKKAIVILDVTNPVVVVVKTLDVGEECFNMLMDKGLFLVVCIGYPATIRFIHPSGEQLKVIDLYNGNEQLRDWYPRIAILPGTEIIYVSSYDDNVVLQIDSVGKVLGALSRDDLLPYGLAVDQENRCVYLCSETHNAIYKMTDKLSEMELFIGGEVVQQPAVLVYHNSKLYISSDSDTLNTITIISIE